MYDKSKMLEDIKKKRAMAKGGMAKGMPDSNADDDFLALEPDDDEIEAGMLDNEMGNADQEQDRKEARRARMERVMSRGPKVAPLVRR